MWCCCRKSAQEETQQPQQQQQHVETELPVLTSPTRRKQYHYHARTATVVTGSDLTLPVEAELASAEADNAANAGIVSPSAQASTSTATSPTGESNAASSRLAASTTASLVSPTAAAPASHPSAAPASSPTSPQIPPFLSVDTHRQNSMSSILMLPPAAPAEDHDGLNDIPPTARSSPSTSFSSRLRPAASPSGAKSPSVTLKKRAHLRTDNPHFFIATDCFYDPHLQSPVTVINPNISAADSAYPTIDGVPMAPPLGIPDAPPMAPPLNGVPMAPSIGGGPIGFQSPKGPPITPLKRLHWEPHTPNSRGGFWDKISKDDVDKESAAMIEHLFRRDDAAEKRASNSLLSSPVSQNQSLQQKYTNNLLSELMSRGIGHATSPAGSSNAAAISAASLEAAMSNGANSNNSNLPTSPVHSGGHHGGLVLSPSAATRAAMKPLMAGAVPSGLAAKHPHGIKRISLLGDKRSYQMEILLRGLKCDFKTIPDGIAELDWSVITSERLQILESCLPTSKEQELVSNYVESGVGTGPTGFETLGTPEQFIWIISFVPSFAFRIKFLQFLLKFDVAARGLAMSYRKMLRACEEIRSSDPLRQVLATVLSAGNILNRGTNKSGAVGFRVQTLQQLNSIKASSTIAVPTNAPSSKFASSSSSSAAINNMTLLDFVVEYTARKRWRAIQQAEWKRKRRESVGNEHSRVVVEENEDDELVQTNQHNSSQLGFKTSRRNSSTTISVISEARPSSRSRMASSPAASPQQQQQQSNAVQTGGRASASKELKEKSTPSPKQTQQPPPGGSPSSLPVRPKAKPDQKKGHKHERMSSDSLSLSLSLSDDSDFEQQPEIKTKLVTKKEKTLTAAIAPLPTTKRKEKRMVKKMVKVLRRKIRPPKLLKPVKVEKKKKQPTKLTTDDGEPICFEEEEEDDFDLGLEDLDLDLDADMDDTVAVDEEEPSSEEEVEVEMEVEEEVEVEVPATAAPPEINEEEVVEEVVEEHEIEVDAGDDVEDGGDYFEEIIEEEEEEEDGEEEVSEERDVDLFQAFDAFAFETNSNAAEMSQSAQSQSHLSEMNDKVSVAPLNLQLQKKKGLSVDPHAGHRTSPANGAQSQPTSRVKAKDFAQLEQQFEKAFMADYEEEKAKELEAELRYGDFPSHPPQSRSPFIALYAASHPLPSSPNTPASNNTSVRETHHGYTASFSSVTPGKSESSDVHDSDSVSATAPPQMTHMRHLTPNSVAVPTTPRSRATSSPAISRSRRSPAPPPLEFPTLWDGVPFLNHQEIVSAVVQLEWNQLQEERAALLNQLADLNAEFESVYCVSHVSQFSTSNPTQPLQNGKAASPQLDPRTGELCLTFIEHATTRLMVLHSLSERASRASEGLVEYFGERSNHSTDPSGGGGGAGSGAAHVLSVLAGFLEEFHTAERKFYMGKLKCKLTHPGTNIPVEVPGSNNNGSSSNRNSLAVPVAAATGLPPGFAVFSPEAAFTSSPTTSYSLLMQEEESDFDVVGWLTTWRRAEQAELDRLRAIAEAEEAKAAAAQRAIDDEKARLEKIRLDKLARAERAKKISEKNLSPLSSKRALASGKGKRGNAPADANSKSTHKRTSSSPPNTAIADDESKRRAREEHLLRKFHSPSRLNMSIEEVEEEEENSPSGGASHTNSPRSRRQGIYQQPLTTVLNDWTQIEIPKLFAYADRQPTADAQSGKHSRNASGSAVQRPNHNRAQSSSNQTSSQATTGASPNAPNLFSQTMPAQLSDPARFSQPNLSQTLTTAAAAGGLTSPKKTSSAQSAATQQQQPAARGFSFSQQDTAKLHPGSPLNTNRKRSPSPSPTTVPTSSPPSTSSGGIKKPTPRLASPQGTNGPTVTAPVAPLQSPAATAAVPVVPSINPHAALIPNMPYQHLQSAWSIYANTYSGFGQSAAAAAATASSSQDGVPVSPISPFQNAAQQYLSPTLPSKRSTTSPTMAPLTTPPMASTAPAAIPRESVIYSNSSVFAQNLVQPSSSRTGVSSPPASASGSSNSNKKASINKNSSVRNSSQSPTRKLVMTAPPVVGTRSSQNTPQAKWNTSTNPIS